MIRLQQITVQAFRGVPDRIELDLSAPLILLYAPNGSGKTTICEAAEWLLTGIIKRLESSDADHGKLRCGFAKPTVPTLVSAILDVDGEAIALERRLNSCRWKLGDAGWKSVNKSDLLQKLAPSAVEEDVNAKYANRSRQIWLRGTRFLSGEALATLLDSDEESVSGREKLFADLLGVGHLLEIERQLDGYVGELNKYLRDQQTRVADKDAEIANRGARLSRDANATRASRLNSAMASLRTASEHLKRRIAQPRQPAVANVRSLLTESAPIWKDKRRAGRKCVRPSCAWPPIGTAATRWCRPLPRIRSA